jgi:hypothetical protein
VVLLAGLGQQTPRSLIGHGGTWGAPCERDSLVTRSLHSLRRASRLQGLRSRAISEK